MPAPCTRTTAGSPASAATPPVPAKTVLPSSENCIGSLRRGLEANRLLRRAQRLREVVDDVVDVLEADRKADHVLADARSGERRGIELLMGRARRMDDERLGVADIGEMRGELQTVDEALAG